MPFKKFLKIFSKSLAANLVPALMVLIPGTLLTIAQKAVYAEYVFIPLTAFVVFTLIFLGNVIKNPFTAFFKANNLPVALHVLTAVIILTVAHFALVGFNGKGLVGFIIYIVFAALGAVIGLLARKLNK